ncbi:MAG: MFS transporter [Ignavibacteria bacterium]|nr:MFS transporter [Ignavibacteria bacterium]
MKKLSGNLALIFLVVLVDLIGFGIIIPILPRYSETHFGANELQIGILIASFSFFQFLSSPVLGKLSDQIGRKPVITFSLVLSVIGYLVFAFAPNFWIALLARCIGGIGGGSISAAQAYIADVTEKSERTKGMGLIGAAFGLGFILGPFIGGMLASFGYIVPNLAAAGFSFVALILTQLYLNETLKVNGNFKLSLGDLTISLKSSRFSKGFKNIYVGRFLIIFFIVTFSIANTYGVIPIFAYRYLHFTDKEIGYIYAVIGSIGVLFQGYLIGRLTKFLGEKKLLSIGMILMSLGLFLVPFSTEFIFLMWFFVIIISIGLALINPTILSLISKLTSPDEQGQVLGVNQSMGSLGRVLGPIWGGFAFHNFGFEFPFWTASVFTLLALYFGIENFWKMKKNKIEF